MMCLCGFDAHTQRDVQNWMQHPVDDGVPLAAETAYADTYAGWCSKDVGNGQEISLSEDGTVYGQEVIKYLSSVGSSARDTELFAIAIESKGVCSL